MDWPLAASIAFPANWWAGWSLLLAGFVSGAIVGTSFHRDDFWGGYSSFRRRIVRLGHIALCALGFLNLLFALLSHTHSAWTHVASVFFIVGGVAMPAVCFLAGWRKGFRHLFPIPVGSLIVAVICTMCGGLP
jgi:hypothetical protein